MRRKYLSIYAVSLLFAAPVAAAFYAYWIFSMPMRVKALSRAKPAAMVTVPDEQTVREMGRLQNDMGRLAQPVSEGKEPVNLKLFGYEPVQRGDLHGTGGKVFYGQENTHLLTMAFRGEEKGFCVIDGTFYAQGANLPDGSIIRRVGRNRVLLVKKKRKVWVDMVKDSAAREDKASKPGEKK
jgi:hypothetical protein